ncbi:hypothetical protein B0H15DRAFT_832515 [Mycena belliarum]|uniref:Uncharacterized protein n=1 Tax=Mycena belliarum TaxID=1033014 RepID=A0AAD6XU08_9AGAR|nr:hypothetical protein B0H15DRAFT_832515 [Mycena belliae]
MFQVASHPAAFPHHHPAARRGGFEPAAPAPVTLPRTLARPPFTDVSRDALAAADPALAPVPAEFVRHGLRAKAPQMLAGIAALAPSHVPQSLPRSHLPAALTVPLRASPAGAPPPSYPTHVLAIAPAPAKGAPQDRDAPHAIFPVHAVVLAAHCAKLPRLPPAQPAPPARAASATLPLLPLALPSPQAFAILHSFLYTHRLSSALGSLLPLPPAFLEGLTHAAVRAALESGSARHALAAHLCAAAAGNLGTLMGHAGHVKELWQDMVALGVYDSELWDALDLAWEIVLGALNLAAQ